MAVYSGQPVYNPPLPHIGPLPCPILDGFMVVIQGTVPPRCSRFHINLSTGPATNERCDIAMHCNPRFEGENKVVLNSFVNGAWGKEIRPQSFPFVQSQQFECILLVTNTAYKIAVNGAHSCEFQHRISKERVTHLVIEGNVTISCVRFQGTGAIPYVPPTAPQPCAPGYNPPYNPACQPGGVGNYPMGQVPPSGAPPPYPGIQAGAVPPYSSGSGSGYNPLQPGYPAGSSQPGFGQPGFGQPAGAGYGQPAVAGFGQPAGAAYGQPAGAAYGQPAGAGYAQPAAPAFTPPGVAPVAAPYGAAAGGHLPVPYKTMIPPMQQGKKIHVGGMVNHSNATRFNIDLRCGDGPNSDIAFHFNPRMNEATVVRNSLRGGSWGNEERTIPSFPFTPGAVFEITIICGPHAFRVHVNHQDYIRFPHRIKQVQKVTFLEIGGDLCLHNVRVE